VSVRRHVITGEPVLFAPERAARPGAFIGDAPPERCPFCPEHEHDTPPEIARVANGANWLARVFPNKYPPVAGAEIIVESPDHAARFESLAHAADVVRLYADRYRAHAGATYTAIFRNDGAAAGSSMEHLHSQVVPVPFIPARIANELKAFRGACPLCAAIGSHRRDGLVISESDAFAWLAPSGSSFAYQQWIVPKRHVAEMSAFTEDELIELASLLRDVARATSRVAPAYNWAFMNFPRDANGHAYLDVIPRLTTIAGFELGTGTFVEIVDPALAVEVIRGMHQGTT
jgi:UDPglucose--hexose-1-phosphate uridylyltransferase